jgi:ABC-2 type transport system permease protein
MRRAVFAHLQLPPVVRATLSPGVTWGSWTVPPLVELAIVAAIGLAALGVAILEFRKGE